MLYYLILFNLFIVLLCFADFHFIKVSKKPFKTSLFLSVFWVLCGLSFSIFIFYGVEYSSHELAKLKTYEYLSAYFIEKTLSMDNLFVFFYIFSFLKIPLSQQSKLLFIGVFSALIFRFVTIYITFSVMNAFSILIIPLGIILIAIGIKPLLFRNSDTRKSDILDKFKSFISNSKRVKIVYQSKNYAFFKIKNNALHITSAMIAIVIIEVADILFAADSIPAIFAVTNDPMIAYTSNVFAILGLRSIYHLFAITATKLYYFEFAISITMILVGIKMIFSTVLTINPLYSLMTLLIIFAVSIAASFYMAAKMKSKKREVL